MTLPTTVTSVVHSPKDTLIAVSRDNVTIQLINNDRHAYYFSTEHARGVRFVTFSPDGLTIVSCGFFSNILQAYNIVTRMTCTYTCDSNIVSAAYNYNGTLLAIGCLGDSIRIVNAQTFAHLHEFKCSNRVTHVAFSPVCDILMAQKNDYTVQLWDLTTGHTNELINCRANSAVFCNSGNTILTCNGINAITVWNVHNRRPVREFFFTEQLIANIIRISPDGKLIATGGFGTQIRLHNAMTGEIIRVFKNDSHIVRTIAFSQDGKSIISGGNDNNVFKWSIDSDDCTIFDSLPEVIIVPEHEVNDQPEHDLTNVSCGLINVSRKSDCNLTHSSADVLDQDLTD